MAEEAGLPESGPVVVEPEKYMDRQGRIWVQETDPEHIHYNLFRVKGDGCAYSLNTVRDSHGPIHRMSKCPECGREVTERGDRSLRMHRKPSGTPNGWPRVWCPKGAPQ